MVTGELKNKIDAIRQMVWNSGISNPITVVEQITYLMFIHSLDENELHTEQEENLLRQFQPDMKPLKRIFPAVEVGQSMRWSRFKTKPAKEIYRIISTLCFPAMKEIHDGMLPDFDANGELVPRYDEDHSEDSGDFTSFSKFMENAAFLIQDAGVLQKVITAMDGLFENEFYHDHDLEGDFYEYILSQMSASGELGQFRTPQHIRDMMVELVAPGPDALICDPACGTAGFLLSAGNYIRKNHGDNMNAEQWEFFRKKAFTGFDTDPTMTRISAMNLVLHGIDHPNIRRQDSVSKSNTLTGQFDLVLANPAEILGLTA